MIIMQQFEVTGMSCAACSARVEKSVGSLAGVTSCSVSLLTNSMQVEGNVSAEEIISAVEKAGYGAREKVKITQNATDDPNNARAAEEKTASETTGMRAEEKNLRYRLISSLIILALLMYIAMGGVMWGAPLPAFLHENPTIIALVEMILAAAVMVINQKFFINGTKGLIHRAPNMDTLVALGSAASFGYSTYLVFAMAQTSVAGDAHFLHETLHGLYFESAAMILALITLGKMLETRAKGKTTDALKSLMDLSPKTATVIRNGEEMSVPVSQVRKDDIFVVRPGESVPVDGVILEGSAAINESALTGESVPVDKSEGDFVSAATVNQSGFLRCRAERVGEDTTISQIIRMVSDAASTKAPIAKLADKVSGVFVPIVLAIALLTFVGWLTIGKESVGFAIARAISVLVISCPCALGLATPVAIMVGNGVAAKRGILFKTAASLENAGRVQIVALDKTGTITQGVPHVTDIYPMEGMAKTALLTAAAALEQYSEHPLAVAVMEESKRQQIQIPKVTDFSISAGNGLSATLTEGTQDHKLIGGKQNWLETLMGAPLPEQLSAIAKNLAEQGKTPLFFAKDETLLGLIAVADVIKPDSPQAIAALRRMKIHTVMLTGDNERTARAIGDKVGVDEIVAGVLPQEKEQVIRQLQQRGKVAMVGDGINDAPALTRADTGIAIGAGTDVAIDAADVVLMNGSLRDVVTAIQLSRATLRNVRENLFWAFFYNSIGIPLAAGLFISVLGWELNPMFGAAAMSLSSFCVVTNALRLNRFRPIKWEECEPMIESSSVLKNENLMTEDKNMKIKMTIKIEGMMCPHCSGRVKKALEALEEVELAEVSHESGTAIITAVAGDEATLRQLCEKEIVDAGYKVVG